MQAATEISTRLETRTEAKGCINKSHLRERCVERVVSENSGDPFFLPSSHASVHQPTLASIRYPIPTHKAGNGLVTPLGLLVFMDDGDYQLWWLTCMFAP
ncbi:hypothetical protein EVAR_64487_1 [Eumeta japonica]|uniref:Uncharacterized protein n=1 Tax=Eumeta variegata TaxID=151549 RepID=A0A4C1ZSH6_EUMVA|nr:hypothetical protein EVAR_64487_1 [Eumeta japonica]